VLAGSVFFIAGAFKLQIPQAVYWSIATVGLFWAFYRTWLETDLELCTARTKLSTAETRIARLEETLAKERRTVDPQIAFEMEDFYPKPLGDLAGTIRLVVKVSIQNSGQETDIHNWKLRQKREGRDCSYIKAVRITDRPPPWMDEGADIPPSERTDRITVGRNRKWTGWLEFSTYARYEVPDWNSIDSESTVESVVALLRSARTRWIVSCETMDGKAYHSWRTFGLDL
jgi:hypothetical protein